MPHTKNKSKEKFLKFLFILFLMYLALAPLFLYWYFQKRIDTIQQLQILTREELKEATKIIEDMQSTGEEIKSTTESIESILEN